MEILLMAVLGFGLDLILGDPHWLYHPVRLIGLGISGGEKLLRKIFPKTPKGELAAGAVLAVCIPALSFAVPFLLLWLAGLDGIPDSLYEAARVDGAGRLQCFFHVTLPQLAPTLGLVSVLSLLNTFKVFREAYLVAGSYPHESIYMLQHLFNNWFLSLDMGRLTAAAVLVALVLLVIVLPLQRVLKGAEQL